MKADLLRAVKKDLARIQQRGTRRKAKHAAEAAHQAQSCFIANISHDLRTPLMGLLGMATIVQQQVPTEFGKAAVADLLKSGEVLLKLLNEVIDFSRCLPTYFPVYVMKFDLKNVVNDLVALFKPSIQEKQLCFNRQWDEQLPQEVMGDPFLVVEDNIIAQQAIRHLLAAHGASVDTADNGAQALQKIQIKDYALIVMDLGLPDHQGCELAHTICHWQQQQQRNVSVMVALSAHMDAENRQRCLDAGMSDAFAKPLTTQAVPALLTLAKEKLKRTNSEYTEKAYH